jgi:Ca2+-binding RTX toxin-like protein
MNGKTFTGTPNADSLQIVANNAAVNGDDGDDTLWRDTGNNTLTGGVGNDLFVYNTGNDLITDYK